MRIALLIATLVAAVGCGASQGVAGSTPTTELTISYWPEGRGTEAPQRWTLRCNPAGGTVPRAAGVCRQLAAMTNPFAPRSKSLVCTDQYGGPQQALIAGTHRGDRIWTLIGMRNGCDISRAKKLAFLVPGFPASPNS
jgi:Subtilisin inhibitor-like